MKRGKRSRLAIMSIIFAMLSAPAAMADTSVTTQTSQPSLVALGDSITFGYNLGNNKAPSQKAFPYVIGSAKGYRVTDLGVPGWTSGNLLQALTTPRFMTAIRGAKVITVDIGSNDILQPAIKDGLLHASGQPPTLTSAEKLQFVDAIATFGQNLHAILTKIHTVNPQAQIILYNIYDPIPESYVKLRMISELLIGSENAIIATEGSEDHLAVADAYQAFNQQLSTYVLPGHVHPTVAGQQELAKLGLAILARPVAKPYYQTKAQFIYDFLAILGQAPDQSGHSPFKDVATHSYLWGYVHKALQLHLLSPVSSTFFGANSDVTASQAAQIAVNFLHVHLNNGESAFAFAKQQGFLNGLINHPYMTLRDEVLFVTRIENDMQTTSQRVPASWHMTQTEASVLREALKKSMASPYMQLKASMIMQTSGDLTTEGAQSSLAQGILQQMKNTLHMNIEENKGFNDGEPVLSSQVTMIPSPSDNMPVSALTEVQEYVANGNLYMNSGSGWKNIPGLYDLQSVLSNQLGGAALTIGALQDMTIIPISGGYQFEGSLNTQKMDAIIKGLFSSMPMLSQSSGMSSKSSEEFMTRVLNQMQTEVTFTVLATANGYQLNSEQMNVQLTVPFSSIPGVKTKLTGANAVILQDIKDLQLDEHITSNMTYDREIVAQPNGLPH
ncbi:SGNH/GDSL hydrolase family protein [Sulfoacidibacillus ferrooxidans]|uniref:SGNH hydrolase-type esterase domain-containing protein n=1 Tax=Sulfoacidibacillus ferrooxidans TaxID=2005001 RepID=A0A9X1V6F0_9BACL|nr:SGNH/GDSL hydrolase family protein [Sulfoacidibacillus ferrooxidans]MCI0182070.1 hypothetical protein [Sulfoacidibacillus ferrooxidans]